MSSGPGKIQRLILTTLPADPLLYGNLLWQLAENTPGALLVKGKYGNLQKGEISRSFAESFRRAVKSLGDEGRIIISERKFATLEELLDSYAYVTNSLELHQLRKRIKEQMLTYLQTTRKKQRSVDFEHYTIDNIRKSDGELFKKLKGEWNQAEKDILLLLPSQPNIIDIGINIILRGRYLFNLRKSKFDYPLHMFIEGTDHGLDSNVVQRLKLIIEEISNREDWIVGKIKNKIYPIVKLGKNTRTILDDDELKDFLRNNDRELIVNLPYHVEPSRKEKKSCHGRIINIGTFAQRKYDPLLDNLVTRDLFKAHKYLALP